MPLKQNVLPMNGIGTDGWSGGKGKDEAVVEKNSAAKVRDLLWGKMEAKLEKGRSRER